MAQKIILCIDDESTILNSLKAELKNILPRDYLIEMAENGHDALELVDSLIDDGYEIFLVISDYLMPQMKGDEVLKQIHGKLPKTIKIMLTGQATIEGVANAIKDAQLYRYMAKPWRQDDFKLTVTEAVNRYLQDRLLEEKNASLEKLTLQQAELIKEILAQKALDLAYQKLQESHQQLQETQIQLVQSEQVAQQACKKINDSIEYASLIQKAILPAQQLSRFLGEQHCVIWQPRDVVGGDFYVFHLQDDTYLLGIVDCAGHGVPGALMTMLARAALDHAIGKYGISSPAMLLKEMDTTLRNRLQNANILRGLAVNMDAGLVFVNPNQQKMLFAGAKMSLYWTDGQQAQEVKGNNRAILGNKVGQYEDIHLTITADVTFCMASDGILDQAGGTDGFGFGNSRFTKLFCQQAAQSPSEQAKTMMAAINHYRGDYAQRDDITLLFFKPQPKRQEFSDADY